jgi:hypothetical protein
VLLQLWGRKISLHHFVSDTSRIGSAFKGTVVVEGIEKDASTLIRELGNAMKSKIGEVVTARAAQEKVSDLSESQRHGLLAINFMQVGLILLGLSAVTVLIKQ